MRWYPVSPKVWVLLFLLSLLIFLFESGHDVASSAHEVISSWRANGIPTPTPTPTPTSTPIATRPSGPARQLYAEELMSRPLPTDLGSFPRILHQSWKTNELPAKFQSWSQSCRDKHPGWEWVLWTDADNLQLVRKHFPWLEESYRSLPGEIYRADLVRNLYMYIFGGVYADLDTECLLSTEVLLNKYHLPVAGGEVEGEDQLTQVALLGRMGDNPGFEHSIPNAWMAATPGHPFFLQPVQNVHKYVQETGFGNDTSLVLPESLTGPVALREAILEYEVGRVKHGNRMDDATAELVQLGPFADRWDTAHELILLPSEVVYPYSWGGDGEDVRDVCWVLRDGYDAGECKRRLRVEEKGSISITYWSHTHSPTEENKENMKHIIHD